MALLEQLQTELGSAYAIDRELAAAGCRGLPRRGARSDASRRQGPLVRSSPRVSRRSLQARDPARGAAAASAHRSAADRGRTSTACRSTPCRSSRASRCASGCERGPLPLREAMRHPARRRAALAYAHAHGIVHRDIKPENVLLSRRRGDGHRLRHREGAERVATQPRRRDAHADRHAIGTPAYMAPEQAAGDRRDHRADIYAFGASRTRCSRGTRRFTAGRSIRSSRRRLPNRRRLSQRCATACRPALHRWSTAASRKPWTTVHRAPPSCWLASTRWQHRQHRRRLRA